jgi:hypothetical protein
MLTTFENLSPNMLNQLAQLIQKIATTLHPEKILCYGYRTSIYQDWTCFNGDTGYLETIKATFDLLIITGNDNKEADHEILQKIDLLAASEDCDVTAVVQPLDAVNEFPAITRKIPILSGLSGLLTGEEEVGDSLIGIGNDNETAPSASFSKKEPADPSKFDAATERKLAFIQGMEDAFTEPQLEKVIEIIQGLVAKPEQLDIIHGLLYEKPLQKSKAA